MYGALERTKHKRNLMTSHAYDAALSLGRQAGRQAAGKQASDIAYFSLA
jgi:hypothetical protein